MEAQNIFSNTNKEAETYRTDLQLTEALQEILLACLSVACLCKLLESLSVLNSEFRFCGILFGIILYRLLRKNSGSTSLHGAGCLFLAGAVFSGIALLQSGQAALVGDTSANFFGALFVKAYVVSLVKTAVSLSFIAGLLAVLYGLKDISRDTARAKQFVLLKNLYVLYLLLQVAAVAGIGFFSGYIIKNKTLSSLVHCLKMLRFPVLVILGIWAVVQLHALCRELRKAVPEADTEKRTGHIFLCCTLPLLILFSLQIGVRFCFVKAAADTAVEKSFLTFDSSETNLSGYLPMQSTERICDGEDLYNRMDGAVCYASLSVPKENITLRSTGISQYTAAYSLEMTEYLMGSNLLLKLRPLMADYTITLEDGTFVGATYCVDMVKDVLQGEGDRAVLPVSVFYRETETASLMYFYHIDAPSLYEDTQVYAVGNMRTLTLWNEEVKIYARLFFLFNICLGVLLTVLSCKVSLDRKPEV